MFNNFRLDGLIRKKLFVENVKRVTGWVDMHGMDGWMENLRTAYSIKFVSS
jgi:hypothetical protein